VRYLVWFEINVTKTGDYINGQDIYVITVDWTTI
jgi:hypothetical protein